MELEELKNRVAKLEAQLAEKSALVDILLTHNPDGICILGPAGELEVNPAGAAIVQSSASSHAEDWKESYGFFKADRKTRMEANDTPLLKAMLTGEPVDETIYMVSPDQPDGVVLACSARRLPSGGAISVFRDVTRQTKLEADLARKNEDLARRDEQNRDLIERLRLALDELSTPVLEVSDDVIVLPVIGVVDSQRSAQMSERLLSEVVRTKARIVIVDITGVEVIDTATADRFAKLARGVELLGARCLLCGIQPAVAQTLVEIGVHFGGMATQRNLQHALEASKAALAQRSRPRAEDRG